MWGASTNGGMYTSVNQGTINGGAIGGGAVGGGGVIGGGGGAIAGGGVVGGGGFCGNNSAGECSGACGGLEVACCAAEGEVTKTDWQYVGSGGSYNAVTSYNYVGAGAGQYEKETTTVYYGWKFRKCCVGFSGLLLVAALLFLLMNMVEPGPEPQPNTPQPPQNPVTTQAPTAAPPMYDCSKPGLWTLMKKDWCCKHYGRGCPTRPPPRPKPQPHPVPVPVPAPPVVHTSLPYDCNADYLNCYHCLMARWSVSKRAWCCAHARRGCPTGAPPPHVPPPAPATTSLPFDCNAGFSNWQAGWSGGKKAWCCDHMHRGCPPPPPVMPLPPATSACPPMDCNQAYNNWRRAWTPEKQHYCCIHEHKACNP